MPLPRRARSRSSDHSPAPGPESVAVAGLPPEWRRLVEAARAVRRKAYAPYSHFRVGAALEGSDGAIYAGCNVENLSFGLTCCAERVALQSAIASGCRSFVRYVVISDSRKPISPCGACRQVISEFVDDIPILSVTLRGRGAFLSLANLLPRARTGILG